MDHPFFYKSHFTVAFEISFITVFTKLNIIIISIISYNVKLMRFVGSYVQGGA
jgi:hypothetical protein